MKIEEYEFEEKRSEICIRIYKEVRNAILIAENKGYKLRYHPDIAFEFTEDRRKLQLIHTWKRIWKLVKFHENINIKTTFTLKANRIDKSTEILHDGYFDPIMVFPDYFVVYVGTEIIAELDLARRKK